MAMGSMVGRLGRRVLVPGERFAILREVARQFPESRGYVNRRVAIGSMGTDEFGQRMRPFTVRARYHDTLLSRSPKGEWVNTKISGRYYPENKEFGYPQGFFGQLFGVFKQFLGA